LDTRTGRAAKRSALGRLFDRVKSRQRVAQPYLRRTGLGPADSTMADGDLVEHLDLQFRDPLARATLRIIDGPAGSGKTVGFESLVVALYEEFIEAKKHQVERPRPIVFLPEHIRGELLSGYVDNVIDAAMEAEAARPVEADQLRFLLSNGYCMWLFDGLDEFFGNDNNFFEYLGNELSNPESRAQVLICSRDSLLTSSSALRDFIEAQIAKGSAIEIYELAAWGPDAWQKIAWMELESGIAGREASPRVRAFVDALSASPELSQLAALPFYCTVMLEVFRKSAELPNDPLAVLDTIIDRMLAREGDKLVFQWRDFVDMDALDAMEDSPALAADATLSHDLQHKLVEKVLDDAGRTNLRLLLGMVAHRRARQAHTEIEIDDLREAIGPAFIAAADDEGESARILLSVVQFAFFGAGKRSVSVDFTHPILAEYMAAAYAMHLLRAATERFAATTPQNAMARLGIAKSAVRQALGSEKLSEESVFFRALSREIAAEAPVSSFLATALGLFGKDEKKLSASVSLLLSR
jgi:hypothetical protein